MQYSMTGFGRGEAHTSVCTVVVEIKTVNSKSLDISSVRLPTRYRPFESWLRGELSKKLRRGKVDCAVSYIWNEGYGYSMPVLDRASFNSVLDQMCEATRKRNLSIPEEEVALMALRSSALWENADTPLNPEEQPAFQEAVAVALAELNEHRRVEGQVTEDNLRMQVEAILQNLQRVEGLCAARFDAMMERNRENLVALLSSLNALEDNQRLVEEFRYQVEKFDINEEIVRLKEHCRLFGETLSEANGVGRKLNFLSQEMGREINTIGSKSNYAPMQHCVVEMKDSLERIKEQLLNIL